MNAHLRYDHRGQPTTAELSRRIECLEARSVLVGVPLAVGVRRHVDGVPGPRLAEGLGWLKEAIQNVKLG